MSRKRLSSDLRRANTLADWLIEDSLRFEKARERAIEVEKGAMPKIHPRIQRRTKRMQSRAAAKPD